MIPLISKAAKKVGTMVAKKGAQKVAQKGAQKVAQKGAQKVAQKGAQKVAQKGAEKTATNIAEKGAQKGFKGVAEKGLKKFGQFEKDNWKNGQKANQNKGPEEDSKYEYTGNPPKFHKGGTVKKSGLAELKKGEVVLTEKQAHKLKRVGGKTAVKKVSAHKKLIKKRVAAKRS